jgi:DNA mismatch repair protein MutS
LIAPPDERVCEVEGLYNLQLALHLAGQQPGDLTGRVITSDSILGARGRIVILTGPNQGGKTTYLQAVGQAHALAQAGLSIPGRQARVSPADAIFTHFPIEERLERGTGRFGDEARRVRAIFEGVTRRSLVLLNETFATTSAGESLYLARDVVRLLRRLGARAIYTTHLHELASDLDQLNASIPGDSAIVSMVALAVTEGDGEPSETSPRFRIELRPPAGRSYAERIATRYGIALEQLTELLQAREVLPNQEAAVE